MAAPAAPARNRLLQHEYGRAPGYAAVNLSKPILTIGKTGPQWFRAKVSDDEKRMGKKAMSAVPQHNSLRKRGLFAGLLRRFIVDARGVTAIEFAVLALPFSLMLFVILESCISFAGSQVLANAADDIARRMRTGQEKTMDKEKLQNLVCAEIKIIVANDCPGLYVDLRTFTTFSGATTVKKYMLSDDLDNNDFRVELGGPQTINMLRLYYKWPIFTDNIIGLLQNGKEGKTVHFAAVIWRNEPFNN
ncbi:TadE/TadG family type IV pilus assembly protein [Mesorhizobium sp. IMUNJ 23232]|uniref:TadE/TadG family type IV pilus assembly protein n=1 Tax=Mesorhizobium sp. IMUNJ 23232 TaxID=3376064 RepID=UPI00378889C4